MSIFDDYVNEDGERELSPFGCKDCRKAWEDVDHCDECGVCPCVCHEEEA